MIARVRQRVLLAVAGAVVSSAVVSSACHRNGAEDCASIALDTPVSAFDTRRAYSFGTPKNPRGPVDGVVCCASCRTAVCRCPADCTEPFYRDGTALELPATMETYAEYPQLSSEWAICQLWSYKDRVGAVWWAPMY